MSYEVPKYLKKKLTKRHKSTDLYQSLALHNNLSEEDFKKNIKAVKKIFK